jgi:hypothetical protein
LSSEQLKLFPCIWGNVGLSFSIFMGPQKFYFKTMFFCKQILINSNTANNISVRDSWPCSRLSFTTGTKKHVVQSGQEHIRHTWDRVVKLTNNITHKLTSLKQLSPPAGFGFTVGGFCSTLKVFSACFLVFPAEGFRSLANNRLLRSRSTPSCKYYM